MTGFAFVKVPHEGYLLQQLPKELNGSNERRVTVRIRTDQAIETELLVPLVPGLEPD